MVQVGYNLRQVISWFLSYMQTTEAHASLLICAGSHEPSLFSYTEQGHDQLYAAKS